MQYHNKKVLALPFGEYFSILEKIFKQGKESWGWTNKFVSTSLYFKPYERFLESPEDIFVLPNLSKKQPWESDLQAVEKVKQIMASAERAVGVPVNRILLSNERKIGRAYSRANYYWPEDEQARSSLEDPSFSDRVLMRAFHFAITVLEDFRPDFCLGSPTGGIINAVYYYVAQHYNIPYVACMASLTLPNHHVWTPEWGSFNTDIDAAYHALLKEGVAPSQASIDYIRNFRKAPEPMPHYKKLWQDKNNQLNLRNIHKAIFQRFMYRLIPFLKGEKIANPKPFFSLIFNNYREYLLTRRQKGLYQSFRGEELSQFKYIYYPFHLDPEIVLNVQAPMWHNQLNTIRMLSYNLPANYKLIVREHRYNVGRRATSYLNEIKKFPGTVLVDAFENQYKYIKNADLVVTVNGTTGFEGLMLKRPVLTLDRTFYDSLSFVNSFKNCHDLGREILRALSSPECATDYDQYLALFIDAEHKVTLNAEASPEDEMNYIQTVLNENQPENFNATTKNTTELLC